MPWGGVDAFLKILEKHGRGSKKVQEENVKGEKPEQKAKAKVLERTG